MGEPKSKVKLHTFLFYISNKSTYLRGNLVRMNWEGKGEPVRKIYNKYYHIQKNVMLTILKNHIYITINVSEHVMYGSLKV